jgi:hypothetical protein
MEGFRNKTDNPIMAPPHLGLSPISDFSITGASQESQHFLRGKRSMLSSCDFTTAQSSSRIL